MPVPIIAAAAKVAAPLLKKAAVKAGKKLAVNAASKAMSKKKEEKQAKKGMKVKKYKKGGKTKKYKLGGNLEDFEGTGTTAGGANNNGDNGDNGEEVEQQGEEQEASDAADAASEESDDATKDVDLKEKADKKSKVKAALSKFAKGYKSRMAQEPGFQRARRSMKSYRKGGKMAKRMLKKGGKFPDLSGDGKVTKKDILIGRGIIKKKK